MLLDAFLTLLGLALVSTWTPGPNNSLLASSGATFGVWATLPMILGINTGFPILLVVVALGLSEIFQQSPVFAEVLRWVGAALLLWIAFKIATSSTISKDDAPRRPFTFMQSVGFQFVNPKGWAVAVALTSQFVVGEQATQIAIIVAVVFAFVGLTSAFGWTLFGKAIGRVLNTHTRLLWFNRTMALFIVGFLVLLLLDGPVEI